VEKPRNLLYFAQQYVHGFIRRNGGWNNWIIHIIEWCPDLKTHEELIDKEKWYILSDPNTSLNLVREEPEKDTYVAKNVEDYEEYYYYPDLSVLRRAKYEKALRLGKVMFL
jgi:hypothetical protein